MRRTFIVMSLVCAAALPSSAEGLRQTNPLELKFKIPLGDVTGRFDHMAFYLARQRLFVAELGNNSVGIVDLRDRKVVRRIVGLRKPQGVGYEPATDTLYVANAGDGSIRLFEGENYSPTGRIDLGDDADNVRIEPVTHRVFVGYGRGALAEIDATQRRKAADIALRAHPESFQLDSRSERIFVNVPDARAVAVVDRSTRKQSASWSTRGNGANFPMAIDENSDRVLVIFRNPAKLVALEMQSGTLRSSVATCGDSDDLFVDHKRQRVYVSCGEGYLDVFEARPAAYEQIAHLATIPGARTSLFVPELDTFALAVRAARDQPASIWLYHPAP
jgi:DNA-binding beta-propeller fold protein YncE